MQAIVGCVYEARHKKAIVRVDKFSHNDPKGCCFAASRNNSGIVSTAYAGSLPGYSTVERPDYSEISHGGIMIADKKVRCRQTGRGGVGGVSGNNIGI